ncbi:MAG: HAMP domain-containing histidine kinase [Deltaproteobacteria bacterium]|nr:HAMP domain-containing histidine kinase [Deltaproteobacteria bacterium]
MELRHIERDRTRRFLKTQATLVAVVMLLMAGGVLVGAVPNGPMFQGGTAACLVVLALTGVGWWQFLRSDATTTLVTTLLYADSVVGMLAFYLLGEFETPNVGTVALLVVMAPLFGVKKHAYGIATLLTVMYVGLLGAREWDLIPYGYVFPKEAFDATAGQYPSFIADSIMGFMMLVYGAALLAGEASLGLLTSRQELREEIDKATARLTRANQELKQRNSALDQFNIAVSHDLTSPLQTALLRTELLMTEPPGLVGEQHELVLAVRESIERMGELTRELYNLSMMTHELRGMQEVDLAVIVSQVQGDLHRRLSEAGTLLVLRDPIPKVMGNAPLLRDCIQNLVENAVRYGGRPARVHIEPQSTEAGCVAIAVEDNGPGIPPRDRGRVFRPFVQLDEDAKEGHGSGLAIVERIVTLHGGTIRIEDAHELGGARFILELPASRPES